MAFSHQRSVLSSLETDIVFSVRLLDFESGNIAFIFIFLIVFMQLPALSIYLIQWKLWGKEILWKNCYLWFWGPSNFSLFKFSWLFYDFPLVRFILCNSVQPAQESKAFSIKYFDEELHTPGKLNQKQLFKSFCSKYQPDFWRKACVYVFIFSFPDFLYLKYDTPEIVFLLMAWNFLFASIIPCEIIQKQNPWS